MAHPDHSINGPSPLTLREYEQRLEDAKYFYEQKALDLKQHLVDALAHEVRLQTAKDEAKDRALSGQAVEYERRLGELNHAHRNAEEMLRKTVSREVFDQFQKENTGRINGAATFSSFAALEGKVEVLIRQSDRTAGALNLLRYMGVAGVIALLLGLLRLVGLIT